MTKKKIVASLSPIRSTTSSKLQSGNSQFEDKLASHPDLNLTFPRRAWENETSDFSERLEIFSSTQNNESMLRPEQLHFSRLKIPSPDC